MNRWLFVFKEGELVLADPDYDGYHADWFVREGWDQPSLDTFLNKNVRGYFKNNELYFYRGENFIYDDQDIDFIVSHLKDLQEAYQFSKDTQVYAGSRHGVQKMKLLWDSSKLSS